MLGISALIDLLRDRVEKRRALTEMDGCTITTAANATVNLAVTPANGLRLAYVSVRPNPMGSVDDAILTMGTMIFNLYRTASNGHTMYDPLRDLKTVDGTTVSITSNAAAHTVYAAHEAL